MAKPRIVQCLCGPKRHAILAFPYEPGITAAQAEFGSSDDITLTEANAAEYMRGLIDGLIARHAINPWCGLCGSPRTAWMFEDAVTKFETMEEVLRAAREVELQQAAARQALGGRQN